MEYDSAMKTNIIVDTTLVNLEVKIKQAKENTHTHMCVCVLLARYVGS